MLFPAQSQTFQRWRIAIRTSVVAMAAKILIVKRGVPGVSGAAIGSIAVNLVNDYSPVAKAAVITSNDSHKYFALDSSARILHSGITS